MKRLQINISDEEYDKIKKYSRQNAKPVSKIILDVINFHEKGLDGFKRMKSDYEKKENALLHRVIEHKVQIDLLAGIIERNLKPNSVEDIEVIYTQVKKDSPMDKLAGCSGYLPKDKKDE